jgi:hypothetical protein
MATVMNIIVSGDPEHTDKMKKALQAIIYGDRVDVYDNNDEDDIFHIDEIDDDTNIVNVSLLDEEKLVGQNDDGIWIYSTTPPKDVLQMCCAIVKGRLQRNAQYLQDLCDSV